MLKFVVDLLFPLGLMGCSDEDDHDDHDHLKKNNEVEINEVEDEIKENLKDDSEMEEDLINSDDLN